MSPEATKSSKAAGTGDEPGGRLIRVMLSGASAARLGLLDETRRAIDDLQAEGRFAPFRASGQPDDGDSYALHVSLQQGRLVLDVRRDDDTAVVIHALSLGPFRSIVKDYDMLVASHMAAVQQGREERVQAIDMGRRGLHDEGARLVVSRLAGKIAVDFPTARRLFTLICALHWRR